MSRKNLSTPTWADVRTVHDEQKVTDVKGYIPAHLGIESDVAHRAFPNPIEVDTDKVAFRVDDRGSGITAGSVVRGDEADRLAIMAALGVDVAEHLRDVVVENVGIILLDYTLEG